MAIKKLVAVILAFFLLSGIYVNPAMSKNINPKNITAQKANLLRTINLLRHQKNQKPLLLSEKSRVSLKKSTAATDGGTISGKLYYGDNPYFEPYYYPVFVAVWPVDSTGDSYIRYALAYPEGKYQIENLPPGEYYVFAIADGFVPKFYNNALNYHDATLVPVAEGDFVEGIDFKMERVIQGQGSISGLVAEEATSSPIANAVVTVWSPDNPFFYGKAESGNNGEYTVTGLKSGNYYAYAFADGFMAEYFNNAGLIKDATLIKVTEPNETSPINFSLQEGGKISGTVVNEDGKPVEGAYIEAAPTSWYVRVDPATGRSDSLVVWDSTYVDSWGQAVTDENGKYTITGLLTGKYYVSVSAGDYYIWIFEWYDDARTISDATPVAVELGKETSPIDFEIDLTVYDGEIFGTVLNSDGDPIADAFVYATPANPDSFYYYPYTYAYTDKEGKYRIKNLPDGKYFVMASASNGWQYVQRWWPDAETQEQAQPVPVGNGTEPQPIDFKLPITVGTAVLTGFVKSSAGEPLANAFIELSSIDIRDSVLPMQTIWAYANTDKDGFYKIENLPEGIYVANAQYWLDDQFGQQWYDHQDSRENATPIPIALGDSIDNINFDLEIRSYYGDLEGTVSHDVLDIVIDRAYIEITPLNSRIVDMPFFQWPYYATVDENGHYKAGRLPSGEYLLAVYVDGAFEYYQDAIVPEDATPVQIVGGATTTINFSVSTTYDCPGVISGFVYDEYTDAGYLEIAVVTARPVVTILSYPDSEKFYTAVTKKDGSYELRGLPEGEFYVFAFAPYHIGEFYKDAYDPVDATPVKVDSLNPATGIGFTLLPVMYLENRYWDAENGPQISASIVGDVTDLNDNPLTQAFVYLVDENQNPVSFTRTNAEGKYEVANIPPGNYKIKAGQIGYKTKYNGDTLEFGEAQPINLNNGVYELDFKLEPGAVTSVGNNDTQVPETLQLYGNYPNPFNPTTRIAFGLPSEQQVKIIVYNLLGQKVQELFNGRLGAGLHHVTWNGKTQAGQPVPSGVYLYVLRTNNNQLLVKKMTLIK